MIGKIRSRIAGQRFRRAAGQDGFALVMVLMSVSLLTIIGALSLMISLSSLQGAVNMKPEDRAFQIAEDGLAIAHARLTDNMVNSTPYEFSGNSQGGDYAVTITGATPFFNVVCASRYTSGDGTYRRKISENVTWYGDQAFDVMRNYLFYAHHNLSITIGDLAHVGVPIGINGNVRAGNQVSIGLHPVVGLGDGLTINGRVEAMNGVSLDSQAAAIGLGSKLNIKNDIKTNGTAYLHAPGFGLLVFSGYLNCQSVYAENISVQGAGITINGSENSPWSNLQPVYEPRPTFEYFKALAVQQNHFYEGNRTFSDMNLGDMENSSVTVVYCTGDLTLSNFSWEQPNMKGVFVCEGNFYTGLALSFSSGSKFQVIAKGNAVFNNTWNFGSSGGTDEFFIWSGNDAIINMGMFSGIKLQVTSMHDIDVNSYNILSTCQVNYGAPDIDIGGYPIGVTIRDWKELPSE